MILKTSIKVTVNPNYLNKQCTKAEHAVAVEAERDSRRYIPTESGRLRGSGRVTGNVITWTPPYARVIYFGNVYVDPKYRKGGFTYPHLGIIRSRRGVKKINSGRKFNITRGSSGWFTQAKKVYLTKWLKTAEEVIERGK